MTTIEVCALIATCSCCVVPWGLVVIGGAATAFVTWRDTRPSR